VLTMPFVNPQNGPIMVEGAEPGDTLAVHIESMAPRGPNPRGTCCMIPQFGALSGTAFTALLNELAARDHPQDRRGRRGRVLEQARHACPTGRTSAR
jgi:acetamidase/formamidase